MTDKQTKPTPKNTPLDMKKWRTIISDWEVNKENQKTYCERMGIKINTFVYARSKLMKSKNRIKNNFIPITVTHAEKPIPAIAAEKIIIENSKGFKIHLSAELSENNLTKIFKSCGW